MMMTGEQYKESLKDGRYTYLDGKRVTDPANEPRLKAAVRRRRGRVRQLPFG